METEQKALTARAQTSVPSSLGADFHTQLHTAVERVQRELKRELTPQTLEQQYIRQHLQSQNTLLARLTEDVDALPVNIHNAVLQPVQSLTKLLQTLVQILATKEKPAEQSSSVQRITEPASSLSVSPKADTEASTEALAAETEQLRRAGAENEQLRAQLFREQERAKRYIAQIEELEQSAKAISTRDVTMLTTFATPRGLPQNGAKPRLLIVDDSQTNLAILKTILQEEIFDMEFVSDGNQALDTIAEQPPDIMLLDIIMPDIDGYEVCRQVKATPETKEIPVIFMSGVGNADAIVKGFEVGGADYVVKPFQKAEIIARLKFHYELYHIRRQQQHFIEDLQLEQEKSEQLLLNILPEAVADRLKSGEGIIADAFPNVSVLFADIVGFTKLSARVSPIELVEMLNVVFSAFDNVNQHYRLEKIKTIGDAYMIAGGLLNSPANHLEAIVSINVIKLSVNHYF